MSDTPRGAAANYKLMSNEDIKTLPVSSITDPDGAILALWVPSSLLQTGLDVMQAWGFQHKQTYIWVKTRKQTFFNFTKWIKKNILKQSNLSYDKSSYTQAISTIIKSIANVNLSNELSFGMGRLFRQTHEICLIGINNSKIYKILSNKSQRSVSFGENLKHSAKPEHLQDSLELMFPSNVVNKIELFARRQRQGYLCLGNEAPMTKGEDIYLSLNKIINATDIELMSINKLISCYEVEKNQELFEMWEKISNKD